MQTWSVPSSPFQGFSEYNPHTPPYGTHSWRKSGNTGTDPRERSVLAQSLLSPRDISAHTTRQNFDHTDKQFCCLDHHECMPLSTLTVQKSGWLMVCSTTQINQMDVFPVVSQRCQGVQDTLGSIRIDDTDIHAGQDNAPCCPACCISALYVLGIAALSAGTPLDICSALF